MFWDLVRDSCALKWRLLTLKKKKSLIHMTPKIATFGPLLNTFLPNKISTCSIMASPRQNCNTNDFSENIPENPPKQHIEKAGKRKWWKKC